jgi:hypothetical protein
VSARCDGKGALRRGWREGQRDVGTDVGTDGLSSKRWRDEERAGGDDKLQCQIVCMYACAFACEALRARMRTNNI